MGSIPVLGVELTAATKACYERRSSPSSKPLITLKDIVDVSNPFLSANQSWLMFGFPEYNLDHRLAGMGVVK